jgi:hypothetical protein
VEQPPVSLGSATISKTKQCPGGHHGRAQPYKPTPQEKGKWHATRGKVPNGATEQDWIQAYNRADDKVRKSFGKKKAACKKAAGAREIEETRDAAIDDLIERGMLDYNFGAQMFELGGAQSNCGTSHLPKPSAHMQLL